MNGTAARHPALGLAAKRVLDVVLASMGLLLSVPILGLAAVWILLDSDGPVFYSALRVGWKGKEFRCYKLRTMVVDADAAKKELRSSSNERNGPFFKMENDPRITRVGVWLRRFSIDELPQLINVLIGEMSIVGPRPHALAHDQRYVERLSRYARRHNVKPGITGWAQVWGHRGEITNDHDMHKRLEHDLYYVDNWSLWLDLKIILLTVVSPRARSNAY